MKRRVAIGVIVVVALLTGLSVYVYVTLARELHAARDALTGSLRSVTTADVEEALTHLRKVSLRLDDLPAKLLGLLPIVGDNLDALGALASGLDPVLEAGLDAREALSAFEEEGLMSSGRVRIEAVEKLGPTLDAEIGALEALEDRLSDHLSGLLFPAVWDELDDISLRAQTLRASASEYRRLIEVSRGLLGYQGPRTYIVLLINNAELRGAGGLLSAAGTVEARNGRLELDRFLSVDDLQTRPHRRVPAPAEYERRFAAYKANTTLWKNATFSADVPDVALVAARLLEKVKGIHTDGAIVVDPRGLGALLPPETTVTVPGTTMELTPEELPRFVFSDAYRRFANRDRRQAAILAVGRRAFHEALSAGFGTEDDIARAAAAFGAGHLRVVPFDEVERSVLDGLGASGDLAPVPGDSFMVTVQNFGGGHRRGSKLDFWTRRDVSHVCGVSEVAALCTSEVTLVNQAPADLTPYVAGRPYGLLRSYVEIYVPQAARLSAVTLDGEPVEYRPELQAGRTSVGVYVRIPTGAEATISVAYDLPLQERSYGLVAIPQPLARDATVRITLNLPSDWVVVSDGEPTHGRWELLQPFDRSLRVTAMPDPRTGLSALWRDLVEFWREPLSF